MLNGANESAKTEGNFTPYPLLFPSSSCLLFQQMRLVFYLRPVIRIDGRGFSFNDGLPALGELGVDRNELALILRYIILGKDRFHRALGHAQGAINAFVRVDDQHVRPLAETIHRANIDAIGIFALDAGFGHNVSHTQPLNFKFDFQSYILADQQYGAMRKLAASLMRRSMS